MKKDNKHMIRQDTTIILEETLTQLEALGNEKMRAQNTKNGADDNQFGVRLGDIKKLAKKIKTNHELGPFSVGYRKY